MKGIFDAMMGSSSGLRAIENGGRWKPGAQGPANSPLSIRPESE